MPEGRLPRGIGLAVVAALLFGLSTPAAHWLVEGCTPVLLSAFLYLGSGIGLALVGVFDPDRSARAPLQGRAWSTLAAVVLLGGVLAPVSLLAGLQSTPASSASLLLNLEGVATALLAWYLFGESVDRTLLLGMLCVLTGGALLGLPDAADTLPALLAGGGARGPWLIVLACLCWGLDNNLTRGIAHLDARTIAMWKGLVAGSVNLLLALGYGARWPAPEWILMALLTGFLGYGLSLVAYVRAQSLLGAARTAAWFGLAPFAGVVAALLILQESPPRLLWPAAALMAAGLYLHLRERHAHWHVHAAMGHRHAHRHDEHHQHSHTFAWDGREPHTHPHQHEALTHRHPHYPDLHHRHTHPTPAPVPAERNPPA